MSLTARFEKKILSLIGRQSLSIQLDITNSCNLACAHCYHPNHQNRGNLDSQGWEMVLDQYQELLNILSARPNISICGGEPLVSPNFVPTVESIVRRWGRAFIGVMSNGTQIERKIDTLKKFPLFFQISIESPFSHSHDKIRGKGSFASALNGIRILLEQNFDVHLLVILSDRTFSEIDEMFRLAKDLGVKSLNYTRAIPEGSGKSYFANQDRALLGPSLKLAMQTILKSSREHGVPTNTDKPLYCLVEEGLGTRPNSGYDGLVVGYRGEIKASSRSGLIMGNVQSETLESVYFGHPIFRSLRSGDVGQCGNCEFYERCGGDRNFAYASTGDFLGFDKGCWLKNEKESKNA